MKRIDGQEGTYRANEGIWIEKIREAIGEESTARAVGST